MNKALKTTMLGLGILSVMGLTACQNQATTKQITTEKSPEHLPRHMMHKDFDRDHMPRLSKEERIKFQQQRQQHHAESKAKHDALQKACEGKAGQNITVKIAEQTFTGKCEVFFQPDRINLQKQQPAAQKTDAV